MSLFIKIKEKWDKNCPEFARAVALYSALLVSVSAIWAYYGYKNSVDCACFAACAVAVPVLGGFFGTRTLRGETLFSIGGTFAAFACAAGFSGDPTWKVWVQATGMAAACLTVAAVYTATKDRGKVVVQLAAELLNILGVCLVAVGIYVIPHYLWAFTLGAAASFTGSLSVTHWEAIKVPAEEEPDFVLQPEHAELAGLYWRDYARYGEKKIAKRVLGGKLSPKRIAAVKAAGVAAPVVFSAETQKVIGEDKLSGWSAKQIARERGLGSWPGVYAAIAEVPAAEPEPVPEVPFALNDAQKTKLETQVRQAMNKGRDIPRSADIARKLRIKPTEQALAEVGTAIEAVQKTVEAEHAEVARLERERSWRETEFLLAEKLRADTEEAQEPFTSIAGLAKREEGEPAETVVEQQPAPPAEVLPAAQFVPESEAEDGMPPVEAAASDPEDFAVSAEAPGTPYVLDAKDIKDIRAAQRKNPDWKAAEIAEYFGNKNNAGLIAAIEALPAREPTFLERLGASLSSTFKRKRDEEDDVDDARRNASIDAQVQAKVA